MKLKGRTENTSDTRRKQKEKTKADALECDRNAMERRRKARKQAKSPQSLLLFFFFTVNHSSLWKTKPSDATPTYCLLKSHNRALHGFIMWRIQNKRSHKCTHCMNMVICLKQETKKKKRRCKEACCIDQNQPKKAIIHTSSPHSFALQTRLDGSFQLGNE